MSARSESIRPMRVEASTVDFWQSMLRVAFGVFVGESFAVGLYVLWWPNGPHRVALLAVAAASVSMATVSALLDSVDRPPAMADAVLAGVDAPRRASRSRSPCGSMAGYRARCSS